MRLTSRYSEKSTRELVTLLLASCVTHQIPSTEECGYESLVFSSRFSHLKNMDISSWPIYSTEFL